MRILVIILLLVNFSCKGQSYKGTKLITRTDTISFAGITCHFIGNSIVLGNVGVSPQSKRWPTQLCNLKGCTEDNLGISGQVLQNVNVCGLPVFDKTTIPAYSSNAVLFIALGINDVGLNGSAMSPALFQRTLDTAVVYAHNTKLYAYKQIILVTPYWITGYSNYDAYTTCGHVLSNPYVHMNYIDAVFNVSVKYNTNIVDIYTAMKYNSASGTFLSGDGLHPNNTGATFIAAFINSIKFYNQ